MYIYDRKNDSIDLYTIEAKKEELKEYKRSVLEKSKDNLLYYLITNVEKVRNRFVNSQELSIHDIEFNTHVWTPVIYNTFSILREVIGTKSIAELQEQCERYLENGWLENLDICRDQINLIKQYINGDFDNIPLLRIVEENMQDFYLLRTESDRNDSQTDTNLFVHNIIKLPRSLQILQLLLQGKYEKINDAEITDQLKLFNIDYFNSIKLSDIRDLHASGLVNGSYESTLEKASCGSRILQKYKK